MSICIFPVFGVCFCEHVSLWNEILECTPVSFYAPLLTFYKNKRNGRQSDTWTEQTQNWAWNLKKGHIKYWWHETLEVRKRGPVNHGGADIINKGWNGCSKNIHGYYSSTSAAPSGPFWMREWQELWEWKVAGIISHSCFCNVTTCDLAWNQETATWNEEQKIGLQERQWAEGETVWFEEILIALQWRCSCQWYVQLYLAPPFHWDQAAASPPSHGENLL